MGRHCEIAMVAASGPKGLTSDETVAARREYSTHLRPYGAKMLAGPIADADWAIHIHWAIQNYLGNPDAQHPIPLGRARAKLVGDRYRIEWPSGD